MFACLTHNNSKKVWYPHDDNMVIDLFGGAEHDGALRIDWGGQYGGVISISSPVDGAAISGRTNKEILGTTNMLE